MIEAVKKMWLKALRSKKYKQGTEALKVIDTDGKVEHCCLGVLCELHAKATNTEWKDVSKKLAKMKKDDEHGEVEPKYLTSTSVLPRAVAKWAGLKQTDPVVAVKGYSETCTLSEVNDDGLDFLKIAKIIEKQL